MLSLEILAVIKSTNYLRGKYFVRFTFCYPYYKELFRLFRLL